MEIRDAAPALGAVVEGLDLRRRPSDAEQALLAAALAERFLLVLPDQDLTDSQHVEAVARFGPVVAEAAGTPTFVSNHRPDGSLGSSAASFPIDFGFFPTPYEAISLDGLEIPPAGTETWFVSGVLGARTLPADLRSRVQGCVARQAIDVRSPAGRSGVRAGPSTPTWTAGRRVTSWCGTTARSSTAARMWAPRCPAPSGASSSANPRTCPSSQECA